VVRSCSTAGAYELGMQLCCMLVSGKDRFANTCVHVRHVCVCLCVCVCVCVWCVCVCVCGVCVQC